MKQLGKIDVHGHSLRGTTHTRNHDHFAIASLSKSMRVHQTNLSIDDESRVEGHNQGHLFLVADGVSGGPAPARASRAVVDSVVQYFLNEMPWYHFTDGDPESVLLALDDALKNSQAELLQRARREHAGMATTMTLAFVFWPHLYLAHVGDSRCYLKRDRHLRQLTTDHTVGQFRRSIGENPERSAENVLWNAVGGHDTRISPEVQHHALEPGDVLALVTDGVAHASSRSDLSSVLGLELDARAMCERLLESDGSDDRTAVIVRFSPLESTLARLPRDGSPPSLEAGRGMTDGGPSDPGRSGRSGRTDPGRTGSGRPEPGRHGPTRTEPPRGSLSPRA